jgi:alkaline phosphatase
VASRLGPFVTHVLIVLVAIAVLLALASQFGSFEIAVGNLVLRSQRGVHSELPVPPGATLSAPEPGPRPGRSIDDEHRPRAVILMIGDGMGVGQLSASSALVHGADGRLAIEGFPVVGLVHTSASDDLVTDSAASASALATGFKVPRRSIATLADGSEAVTLFELARERGLATGVVTTGGLVDATSASFVAHAALRTDYPDILRDLLNSRAEVLIGGDWRDYEKAKRDREYLDLVARIEALGSEAGYTVARSESELAVADGPVLALYPPRARGLDDAHGPPLRTSTVAALERVGRDPDGFILVVESEVTDGSGHDNDIARVIAGLHEFDEAVAAAASWASARGDTLVLVTADHDTGGLGIVRGRFTEGRATVRWATDGHTAQWVPIFASGPGAGLFGGVIDNTQIGVTVADLLQLAPFPAIHPIEASVD